LFIDCSDPVGNRLVEINARGIVTNIRHESNLYRGSAEVWVKKEYAEGHIRNMLKELEDCDYRGGRKGSRHLLLIEYATVFGKYVGQGHLTEDDAYDQPITV